MQLICGIFQLDGANANEERLRAMMAQMDVPRLRPSLRHWRDGSVALAVLDFSARGAARPRCRNSTFDYGRRRAARRVP